MGSYPLNNLFQFIKHSNFQIKHNFQAESFASQLLYARSILFRVLLKYVLLCLFIANKNLQLSNLGQNIKITISQFAAKILSILKDAQLKQRKCSGRATKAKMFLRI
jgi:hypothetical protein